MATHALPTRSGHAVNTDQNQGRVMRGRVTLNALGTAATTCVVARSMGWTQCRTASWVVALMVLMGCGMKDDNPTVGLYGDWILIARDSISDAEASLGSNTRQLDELRTAIATHGHERLAPFEVTLAPDGHANWRVAVSGAATERGTWTRAKNGGVVCHFRTGPGEVVGDVMPPDRLQFYWRDNTLWLDAPGGVQLPLRRRDSGARPREPSSGQEGKSSKTR